MMLCVVAFKTIHFAFYRHWCRILILAMFVIALARVVLLGHPYFLLFFFLCGLFQALSRFRVDNLEGWAQIASDSTCWTDWQWFPPPPVASQAHPIGCLCFMFYLLIRIATLQLNSLDTYLSWDLSVTWIWFDSLVDQYYIRNDWIFVLGV